MLCYYRDDRVMVSLGLEARPPFPKGHVLEQGDWSLLRPGAGAPALLARSVVGDLPPAFPRTSACFGRTFQSRTFQSRQSGLCWKHPTPCPIPCALATAAGKGRGLAPSCTARYICGMDSATPSLVFPHAQPPGPGTVTEITPGVLWFRLPLPYRLDHVNIYLIEDDGGWAVLDTGLGTPACRAAWDAILAGPLAGQRLTRMIVTHYHPDHVGLAGWLAERFGLHLAMPRPEYLYSLALQYAPATWAPRHSDRSIAVTACPPR